MSAFCKDLGVTYITRARNEHAKAGNMNSAMAQTNGDLIVIFDADHAPTRDFLQNTVGYFQRDPKLFLVQTPHFFLNPDPVEKNLDTFQRMPSENEMFYSIIQKGLDKWNGTFFCGSAAMISRAALRVTGGFSGESITEDCETALELHSKGWNSIYVDKPMIAGLQPETFVSFIGQRARWCMGMLQILILKRPMFRPGLTMPQRVCYTSSPLFWLFPLSRLTFVAAPALYIFFDLQIYNASFQEFVAYTTFFLISNILMQNRIYGRVRWPWVSELYEYVQSIHLAKSIFLVVKNPRSPSFQVTDKGQTLDESHLSPIAMPFFIAFALLATTTGYAAYRIVVGRSRQRIARHRHGMVGLQPRHRRRVSRRGVRIARASPALPGAGFPQRHVEDGGRRLSGHHFGRLPRRHDDPPDVRLAGALRRLERERGNGGRRDRR